MGERTNLIVEKDNNYRWFGRSIENIGYNYRWFSRSSHFTSLAGSLKRDAGISSCYKSFSTVAEVSTSGLC